MAEDRPSLTTDITSAELLRWYWLKDELTHLARDLRISTAGSKRELTSRIAAFLDGLSLPPPDRRPAAAPPLPEPLTAQTVLPAGQRCTQQLRHYFNGAIGQHFRFDTAMRDFVSNGQGRTLGQAVEHWHRTRSWRSPEIGAQFELNRFLRAWHRDHPGGSSTAALDAWRIHRAQPKDGDART
ncbi:MAG TPA: DUF6434 domain-containing protein [Propionibacteriaceae bacterium]|jgi:hypothetical protein